MTPLAKWENLFCLLFLGILGSALCYVAWNMAIRRIGLVNTNNYIYLNPFVTMVAAAIVLKERITGAGFVGAVLIVGGIIVSEYSGKRPFFGAFYPKEYRDSTYGIDFEELYRRGYRGILFDIDNTLVPHDAPATQESVELFRRLHAIGFHTCLISNNKEPRVTPFAEAMETPYVYKADKPSRKGYQEGMRRMGTDLADTLFIGDQLFTDVWGANRTGLYSILVKPMNPKEEIQIVLKRYREKMRQRTGDHSALLRARELLRARGLDAALTARPANIRYISGFAGTESYLYLSAERAVILTDSRYTLQAEKEGNPDGQPLYPAGGERGKGLPGADHRKGNRLRGAAGAASFGGRRPDAGLRGGCPALWHSGRAPGKIRPSRRAVETPCGRSFHSPGSKERGGDPQDRGSGADRGRGLFLYPGGAETRRH